MGICPPDCFANLFLFYRLDTFKPATTVSGDHDIRYYLHKNLLTSTRFLKYLHKATDFLN
jgi:hypothetical protein